MNGGFTGRKFTIGLIFVITGFIFVLRLFWIQLIDNSYMLSANNNVLRYMTQYPARGLIYDRFGKLLVYNEATYDLMVTPNQLKNIDTAELCSLIGITKEMFAEQLRKARTYSMYKASIFEKQISKETYGFLEEKLYKFPGFFVQPRTLRKYSKPIAAHTFGYVGEVNPDIVEKDPYYKPGDYIGISGIEKSYETDLRGIKGMKIMMVDVHNREKGSFRGGLYDTAAVHGKDLYTTIDMELQEYGELLMTGKKGSVVAIEPSTGEILALVSSPAYDPNLLVGRERTKNYNLLLHDTIKPLFNRALMAQYPPGSTFKLVHALIGLQTGILFPTTTFPCGGGFPLGNGHIVGCHHHPSPLNLKGSIQLSCNSYYCRAFKAIIDNSMFGTSENGYNTWRKYVLDMGFGHKFNNDLPNELPGLIPTTGYYDRYHGKGRWRALTIISLGIGQGEVGITPLQLANLSATCANRGFYYTPHIVRAIGDPKKMNPQFRDKHVVPIDKQYYEIVVEAMQAVVDAGTATNARMDSVIVCGKTGTAQNPHGKDHSIFIAFAPRDNPKIAISVVVENAGFGATWAAPIASLMMEKYLKRKIKRPDVEKRMVECNLIGTK